MKINEPDKLESFDDEQSADGETSDGSYEDPDTLHRLYHDEGLTQAEIAERFDVSQPAISYWCDKHDIEPPNRAGPDVTRWSDQKGYICISDGETIVREHQLVAISRGIDPQLVFGDSSVVIHHETHKRLNLPSAVTIIDDDSVHQELHNGRGLWSMGDDGIPRMNDRASVDDLIVLPTQSDVDSDDTTQSDDDE